MICFIFEISHTKKITRESAVHPISFGLINSRINLFHGSTLVWLNWSAAMERFLKQRSTIMTTSRFFAKCVKTRKKLENNVMLIKYSKKMYVFISDYSEIHKASYQCRIPYLFCLWLLCPIYLLAYCSIEIYRCCAV